MPSRMLCRIRRSCLLCTICATSLSIANCVSTSSRGREDISAALAERTGSSLRPVSIRDVLPPEGVELGDGLSRKEAVAIALWNNPQFGADLAELGFARAELAQAGVLQNPFLSLFFPLGPKQLEFTVTWPVQELWLRPRRVETARMNAERVADRLVENGLDLAESVKVAYANVIRQREIARLAEEVSLAERELAELAESRLRAGDLSELEVDAARTQALQSQDDARRLELEARVAEQRLFSLLGLEPDVLAAGFATEEEMVQEAIGEGVTGLVQDALVARPDVRAAELAIEWAGERLGLERDSYWKISAIVDANGEGKEGFEIGPGLWAEFPIFNRNQGAVSMAEAELERAIRNYAAVRNRVAYEVREAHVQLAEAEASAGIWRDEIVPGLERTSAKTERAEARGDVSHIEVLNAKLSYLRGRWRQAELRCDLSRARARLENAVGQDLGAIR